jgi:hypothetical protein
MSQLIEQPNAPSIAELAEPRESARIEPHPYAYLWTWKWRHFGVVLVFCLFFLFNNYMRLFYSDIWGHVAYGQWMLMHQSLPSEEPFVPLAEGMPVMCTAWLSQVLLAAGGRWGGTEAYSAMFAISLTLAYVILARVCYLQTSRVGLSVAAAILAWGVNWGRHAVIRPEMFGGVCFAILLWLVVRSDPKRTRRPLSEPETLSAWDQVLLWTGVPLLFALWANLHGSFLVGFAVLGSYALGRGVEVFWKEHRIGALLSDSEFRRWVLLTELAVLGTLLNPYGMDLLLHTVLFPSNPNLKDIMEWFPLEMVSVEGVTVGCSWILLLFLFRHSRARVSVSDVLLLAVFTLAVCLRVRMVAWYGPVWMLVMAPHLSDVFDQAKTWAFRRRDLVLANGSSLGSSRIFMFSALAVWLTFAFSPMSLLVLDGKPRAREMQYHGQTPLGITDFLRENPPEGLVANPQWWGDWLVWEGPKDLQVMMTTNAVHIVPPKVWRDYLAIAGGQSNMHSLLSKYRINTIIVHKELQADLHRAIRQSLSWKIEYEDDLGLIAVRERTSPSEEETSTESDAEVARSLEDGSISRLDAVASRAFHGSQD